MSDSQRSRLVRVEGVAKAFGKNRVLESLNLNIYADEVLGFLGRNGAGKSTAIKIIMGILEADSGVVEVFDQAVSLNHVPIRQRIGYVAQEQHFYDWMTPRSIGRFVARLYPTWNADYYADLIAQFALPEKQKISTFSGGMKAKLALALALAPEPELLLLDEPTAGMDPMVRHEFLNIVAERARKPGMGTFFSTHVIDDIEAIADRICVLDQGSMAYDGDIDALTHRYITIAVDGNTSNESIAALPVPESIINASTIVSDTTRLGIRRVTANLINPPLAPHTVIAPWRLEPMSLEKVFLSLAEEMRSGPPQ